MKHSYSSLKHSCLAAATALVLSANVSAQETTFPEYNFTSADLIKERPQGQTLTYQRQGEDVQAYFGGVEYNTQDGMKLEIVLDPDGSTVWFYNILASAGSCQAWVKGTIEGDKIVVPQGQIMYFEDRTTYYTAYVLCNICPNPEGDPNSYDAYSCLTGDIEFSYVDGVISLMPNESGYAAIGLQRYSTDSFIQEYGLNYKWLGYGDMESKYTIFDEKAFEIPEGLPITQYSITYTAYPDGNPVGHLVEVMSDDEYVYVKGLSQKAPDIVVRAKKDGDNLIWDDTLYLGTLRVGYDDFFVYLCTAEIVDDMVEFSSEIVSTFDAESGKWVTDGILLLNAGTQDIKCSDIWYDLTLAPYNYSLVQPANPTIGEFYEYNEMWGECQISVSIPCVDVDGNFINPDYLKFKMFVNGEPFEFVPSDMEYFDLTAPMTEIPYNFTSYFINQYAPGLWAITFFGEEPTSIGVQSIYGMGEDVKVSDVMIYATSGIIEATDELETISTRYFNLSGIEVSADYKGLVIKVDHFCDGTSKSTKLLNR